MGKVRHAQTDITNAFILQQHLTEGYLHYLRLPCDRTAALHRDKQRCKHASTCESDIQVYRILQTLCNSQGDL